MKKGKGCFFFYLGTLGVITLYLQRQYSQRNLARITGPEGIMDPEVIQAFNRIADLPQMALLRRLILQRALGYCRVGHALDLGCGPGQLVVELARASDQLFVTGIDLSGEALQAARQRAARAGVGDRVDFRTSDAAEIPLPDDSLDLVVSTLALHHWADPAKVFNEIGRVLRPGGSYVIFDLRRDMILPAWSIIWIATKFGAPRPLREINEPMASREASYTPEEAEWLLDQSELAGGEVRAGFGWLFVEGRINPP